ncbi:MAG: TIGR00296 family protein [Acidilobaceae archaeon]|nr:TIGR00296 family protein [Acidilobaceae archaeon]MCX8165108.1 TIGR00296 family protein [Acidilobaceae archaeon]MDW7974376.1 TIGR00296 family protein [Sulfolobales archaeon]
MERIEPEEVSLELARDLVRLARIAIERHFSPERLRIEPRGREMERYGAVFVTLEKEREGRRELRGCVGVLEAYMPIWIATVESALSSAFEDPRFPPLRRRELGEVIITLTVLGRKEPVRSLEEIVIGEHALYVERLYGRRLLSGILLPEVPVDHCWSREVFASMTCMKAGLEERCWEAEGTVLYKIRSRTFRELSPGGEVIEVNLKELYEKCFKA